MTMRPWPLETVSKYISERVFSDADRHVLATLERRCPQDLVEIGCGPGIISRRADFIKNYICTDRSVCFSEYVRRESPASLNVCCDGCELPFKDGAADCVLAMAVMHHLDCHSLENSLREIKRVLRPGGAFILLEDWCFSRGVTPFEEEARKCRFKYGSLENHLAVGTWLLELKWTGFQCGEPVWVNRPFHTSEPWLLKWPADQRTVRMCFFEAVKPG